MSMEILVPITASPATAILLHIYPLIVLEAFGSLGEVTPASRHLLHLLLLPAPPLLQLPILIQQLILESVVQLALGGGRIGEGAGSGG